jgi:HTH-type transcriptional regulator, sugar sensing transcriptional regulator
MKDLTFLGLSKKESEVYVALLGLGLATAKELSSITKLDRTSIYDIMDGLIKKKLIFKQDKSGILHFAPHDPKNLLRDVREKEERIKELLPDLTQKFRTATRSSYVRIYEGEDSLIELYESLLDSKGLSSYDIICSEKDWLQMNPKYFERYKKRRAEKGIHTRLILETSDVAEQRKRNEGKDLSEVKLLPPAFTSLHFSAGTYILPDRVIFISYRKEHTATEIFSKEISEFMQTIFEFMWKVIA